MPQNTSVSDADLIQQTLEGDRMAFRQLVERYQDYVFSISLQVTRTREEAEEAAQDVFLKMHRMLHTFEGKAKFSTWLYTIAYRTAIDATRRKRHTQVAIDDEDVHLQVEDKSRHTPENTMRQKDLKEQLKEAIDSLKPEDASVITLFYLHEQSVAEIAEVTGLSLSNIKTKLHRLREALRKQLHLQLRTEIDDLL